MVLDKKANTRRSALLQAALSKKIFVHPRHQPSIYGQHTKKNILEQKKCVREPTTTLHLGKYFYTSDINPLFTAKHTNKNILEHKKDILDPTTTRTGIILTAKISNMPHHKKSHPVYDTFIYYDTGSYMILVAFVPNVRHFRLQT